MKQDKTKQKRKIVSTEKTNDTKYCMKKSQTLKILYADFLSFFLEVFIFFKAVSI